MLTTTVGEALQRRRLIVANHALLLAHRDLFHGAADDVLLIVDEAHELENAATQALGSQIDTASLLRIGGDVGSWASDQPDDRSFLTQAARDLDAFLDDRGFQTAAMHVFSTHPPDPLGRSTLRTVTVASPLLPDPSLTR